MADPTRPQTDTWRAPLYGASQEMGTRAIATITLLLDELDALRSAHGRAAIDRDQFFTDLDARTIRIDNA